MNKKDKLDLILLNGKVVLPNETIEELDLGIKDGVIKEIGNLSRSSSIKKIDLKKLTVLPGAIDTQVHFREPGLIHKEDISHGTMAAILGGITTIFEMPNTSPATIDKKQLDLKLKIAHSHAYCNYSFFIGAAKKNITHLSALESLEGCCGVKIFMGSSTGDLLVEDDDSLRKILSSVNRRVAIHSEDEYRLKDRKNILEKKNVSILDHPIWRDEITAIKSTQRLIKIANELKKKIHILHISTKDEIEIIKNNKKFVTCEATPQHLFFQSPECYEKLGSFAQMNPPIRDKSHQAGLWKGIANKTVDVIGSDHAPHTLEEKMQPYPKSPSGMAGVQTLLPIMLNFVNDGKLSIHDLVRLVSYNPCKIYNIKNKGQIKIGFDADLVIVDAKKKFKITNSWIASKCKWTPYDQIKVTGVPISTIVNGNIVMQDNQILGDPKGKKVKF